MKDNGKNNSNQSKKISALRSNLKISHGEVRMKQHMPRCQSSNWKRRISLVLVFTMIFSTFMHQGWFKPQEAHAAIANPQAWTSLFDSATADPASLAFTVNAGSNRLLVVSVARNTTNTSASTCSITYNGATMINAVNDEASVTRQHTWLFYYVVPGTTAVTSNLAFTFTGGTREIAQVSATVFTGVDPITPVLDVQSWNGGTGTTTATAFTTSLTIANAGDQAVGVELHARTASGTSRTFTAGATWALGTNVSRANGTTTAMRTVTVNRNTTAAGSETSFGTWSGSGLASMSGMVIQQLYPPDLAVEDATNPSNANAPRSSLNNALDGFIMRMLAGAGTVNNLTVTGSANFTSTNIPTNGVKVWRDAGTIGVLDGADTLISSSSTAISGNATTVTLAAGEPITTTPGNYLVTVDIQGTATLAQTFTGRVTAASGSTLGTPSYNDTTSATLTVSAVQNLTVGNGTNPVNANVSTGTRNNALDAFTLALSAGSGNIGTLTLTGSANFTSTSISGIRIYRDNGTVGAFDGADVLVPTTYSHAGNTPIISFATPEPVTTATVNYLVLVDFSNAGSDGAFTGRVTAVTGGGLSSVTYNDTSSATLTTKHPSAVTSCGDCHGYTSFFTDSTTSTSRGTPEGAFVGDHNVHVEKIGTACSVCHVAPAGTTSAYYPHRAGTIQMQATIAGGSYSKASPFAQTNTPTTGTCSNISCHGANNPTPQWGVGTASCTDCHAGTITRNMAAGTLDNVVGEFGLAWGHKKSGRGAVTAADCIVCHLEGDFMTQKTSAKHMDGNIDLRDPDGTGETAITNMSGGVFTFTKFATSYAAGSRTTTGHTSNNIDNVLTQKFCMACHDSDGATNPTARTPGGTAEMPFGGIALGANYTAANDAIGTQGLINVKTQFATTNSSYHPVLGPLTRDFPYSTRLAVPYNNIATTRDSNGTTGHVTAVSVVINCFDCHNTATPLTNRTVVAHGNAATLRGTIYAFGAASTLCTTCHTGYTGNQNHATGSAWAATGSSHSVGTNCQDCHGSYQNNTQAPARPINAQNYHGNNALVGGGLWPTVNSRPYAFIRAWGGSAYHRPYRATEFTTGSATCGGSGTATCPSGGMSGNVGDGSLRTYTPGGTY